MDQRRSKSRGVGGAGGGRALPVRGLDSYARLSTRPLHITAFIAPLIALYEFGSAVYLAPSGSGAHQTIKAHRLFDDFFRTFGIAGLFFPGVALLTVLLVWHIFVGDRWKVRPWVLLGMLVESLAWTLPMLVCSALQLRAMRTGAALVEPGVLANFPLLAAQTLSAPNLQWTARVTISIGAGLYEEMLFRLVGIAVVHFALSDILKIREGITAIAAVLITAAAFALYHDVHLAAGQINWPYLLFLLAMGLYLGMLYILRGFGIVVAAHALYDVLVLVLLK